MDERILHIQHCMYQYSRAIYRSIKDLIDPYVDRETRSSSTAARCSPRARRRWSGSPPIRTTSRSRTGRSSRTSAATSRSPCRRRSPGRCTQGVSAAVELRRGADRGGRVRRRRRPLPRDDAQGQAVPAHAAAGARLLPVAPAPRAQPRRCVTRCARLAVRPLGSDRANSESRHRQADPPALAGRVPDGRAAAADGARHQVERRGLLRRCATRRSRAASTPTARSSSRSACRSTSQRDEFTGEELYTLRSERYFLPRARARRRGARGAPDVLLPARGPVRVRRAAAARAAEPRARPLGRRLAAPPTRDRGARRGARPRLLARAAGPARRSSRARSRSSAPSSSATGRSTATTSSRAHAQPVRAPARERRLVRGRPRPRARRHPHVPRLAHPRRHPLRDAPRARLPHARRSSTSRSTAAAPTWQFGDIVGEARIEVAPRHRLVGRARLRRRAQPRRGRRLHHRLRVARPCSRRWILRQDGRAVPLEPAELRPSRRRGRSRRVRARARGRAARRRRREADAGRERRPRRAPRRARSRRSASASCRRCSPTCSPRAARTATASIPAHELRRALPRSPPSSSRSTSRCSTSSTSAAAATRSTPSCAATRCTSTRSSSATRSAVRRA